MPFDGEVEKCRLIHKCQITFLTHGFISPENINCSPEVFVWFNLKLACICCRSLDVTLRFDLRAVSSGVAEKPVALSQQ